MPETLTESRLHSNKHKPNFQKRTLKKLNQIYLQIFKHLNRSFCQKMVLFIVI